MTRLTCYKEQLIILFPTFKSCFAKATNRKAENILESRPLTGTSLAHQVNDPSVFSFSLHLSPKKVK